MQENNCQVGLGFFKGWGNKKKKKQKPAGKDPSPGEKKEQERTVSSDPEKKLKRHERVGNPAA